MWQAFDNQGNPVYPGAPTIPDYQEIHVDKRTHRVRFDRETENEVTVIVEKKPEEINDGKG